MTSTSPVSPMGKVPVVQGPGALNLSSDTYSKNVSSGVAQRRGVKLDIKPLSVLESPSTSPVATSSSDTASMYGWNPSEWDQWMSDMGSSLHTSQSCSILLGMENFGNSCYANSVLQALYYCQPFRNAVMTMDKTPVSPMPSGDTSAPTTLKDVLTRLFHSMALSSLRLSRDERQGRLRQGNTPGTPVILTQNVDAGALKAFLATLHQNCDLFDSTMHHDAHEFLNFVLNRVCEDMMNKHKRRTPKSREQTYTPLSACFNSPSTPRIKRTYIHNLFQGILTNETRCLSCETITNRDEEFLDLSINVEHNTSVASSLRLFSEREMLSGRNKFFCDTCCSLQEAETRMKIKQPPNILALHLKRMKWDEARNAHVKHACRVVFPMDMRLFNTTDQASQPDQLYELFAVVVHIGLGAHQGHYVSLVKIGMRWAIFDDEDVSFIPESDISKYFGDQPEAGSAYVLFYQAVQEEAPPAQAPVQQTQTVADSAPTPLVAKSTSIPTPVAASSTAPQFTPSATKSVPIGVPGHAPTQAPTQQPVPMLVVEPSSIPRDSFMQDLPQPPPEMESPKRVDLHSAGQPVAPVTQSKPTVSSVMRSNSSGAQSPVASHTPSERSGSSHRDNSDVRVSRTDSSSSRDRPESGKKSWLGRTKLGRILS